MALENADNVDNGADVTEESSGTSAGRKPERPAAASGLKYTSLLPSKFAGKAGQDPENHWAAYLDFLNVQGIESNVTDAVYRFRFALEDRASRWYRNKTFADLDDLKTKFIRYFTNSHSRESDSALFDSISKKPDETLEELYGRLLSVANRLGYPEQIAQDKFLRQLPSNLQISIKTLLRSNPGIDIVEEAQAMLHLSTPEHSNPIESINMAAAMPQQQNNLLDSINNMTSKVQSLCDRMVNIATAPPASNNQGQGGHSSRGRGRGRGRFQGPGRYNPYPQPQGRYNQGTGQTPHYSPPQEGYLQQSQAQNNQYTGGQTRGRGRGRGRGNKFFPNVQCHSCHELGHFWRDCPVLRAAYSKPSQMANLPPPPQNFQ